MVAKWLPCWEFVRNTSEVVDFLGYQDASRTVVSQGGCVVLLGFTFSGWDNKCAPDIWMRSQCPETTIRKQYTDKRRNRIDKFSAPSLCTDAAVAMLWWNMFVVLWLKNIGHCVKPACTTGGNLCDWILWIWHCHQITGFFFNCWIDVWSLYGTWIYEFRYSGLRWLNGGC